MASKRKEQLVKIIILDCFDDEIMSLEIQPKDKIKFIKEIIQARDKDKIISQQVLLHKDKQLKPNTTAQSLLPKDSRDMTTLPTVHLKLIFFSTILQSVTSQAEFRNDIKATGGLDIVRKIWGSGTGQERYTKAKGGEWNRADMIAKCNGQGPLLVILQTDKGQVLGGYYPIRFQIPEDKGGWRRASKAFLFCIDPTLGWRTFAVKAPRADKAIWQQSQNNDVLFTFGEGDLSIYANSFHNKNSYSALGGYHYGGGHCGDLLGQKSMYFRVKLIEVYLCREVVEPEAAPAVSVTASAKTPSS